MPARDHYIPGVPCWVDTAQPDPAAAADFYRGLFGWEFEEVMPEGSGANYLIAKLGGGDVAAVGSIPEGAPQFAAWNTYIAVADADATTEKVRAGGGAVLAEPFDVMEAGRHGGAHRPRGRGVQRLAGPPDGRRHGRQRARHAQLQRPGHPQPRAGQGLLPLGVRLGDARRRRRRRDVDAARLRRRPREGQPRPAQDRRRVRRAARLRGRRRRHHAARRRPARHAAPLERDLRGRRRRRHGGEGRRARRPPSSSRRWTCRGCACPCCRTRRGRPSSPASSSPRTRTSGADPGSPRPHVARPRSPRPGAARGSPRPPTRLGPGSGGGDREPRQASAIAG